MSNQPAQPVQSGSATATAAATASDQVTSSGAVSSNSNGQLTAETRIGSLADLRTKAPKVWNAMMMGLAQSIMNDMQHHSDNLVKIMKEYERDA